MSIAYIYNLEKLQTLLPLIIKNQIEKIEKEISDTNQKIKELQDIIDNIADSTEPKSVIEKNYAIKDLEKNNSILEKLNNKVNLRRKELETLVQTNNE
jgi:ribosomal protein L17